MFKSATSMYFTWGNYVFDELRCLGPWTVILFESQTVTLYQSENAMYSIGHYHGWFLSTNTSWVCLYWVSACSELVEMNQIIMNSIKYAITVHMPCVFYTAGSHVCLLNDRRSHVRFFNRIFFNSLEMILCIKNQIVENNSVSF